MKKLLALAAAAALMGFMAIDAAQAQRHGGGFRGGGVSMGGFRGGGGAFRGGTVGMRTGSIGGYRGGYAGRGVYVGRGGAVGRVGVVGPGGYVGRGVAVRGAPYAGRRIAGYPGYRHPGRYGHRYPYYRRGYAWPLVTGFGVVAATSFYDSCWRYDGWQWVNVCYGPYGPYGYY
jgi:hypothetical protein